MNSQEIRQIENVIQYEFKNKKLLEEAFRVEPVADEEAYSSEVFRIPGKRAINFALTHIVMGIYGEVTEEGYRVSTDKHQVNYILDNLYTRDVYARNIQIMGLNNYLNIPDEESYDDMTRRLFESLVGAITVDCNWNQHIITDVVRFFLDADFYLENGFDSFEKHYVAKIYNWCVENNKSFPVYFYTEENNEPVCWVKFGAGKIYGHGKSKTLAKFDAARQIYDKLVAAGFIQNRDEDGYLIGEPAVPVAEAVSYLMKQSENDEIGDVSFTVMPAEGGYTGITSVADEEFTAEAFGKTEDEAKANSAYKMVRYLLGYRVEDQSLEPEE